MKIAQIAPLIESVPPQFYGGTERIVSYLTEELVRQGHEVTLFASGNSKTKAKLVSCVREALRLNPAVKDVIPYYMLMIDEVRKRAEEFDILHFHIDLFQFPAFHGLAEKTVTTLHGRQDFADFIPLYRHFGEFPLVSISSAQRRPIPDANFVATIHHGLPSDLYRPVLKPRGNYLAFLGRISPEKQPDIAIKIAQAANLPLKIAAKVDKADQAYFETRIRPLLAQSDVEFIGEVGEKDKDDFIGNALALLFPIDWPEPFGLVMIEAMACGTPVLAFNCGSIPEVIDNGLTGFIVETAEEAVKILPRLLSLDRQAIRKCFERRFSAQRMASDYLYVYRRLLMNRGKIANDNRPVKPEHSFSSVRKNIN